MKARSGNAAWLANVGALAAAVLSLFVLSIAVHLFWLADRFQWNAAVFSLVGGCFVLMTLGLHVLALRMRIQGGSPLVYLSVPMGVRLLVTFLLLVGLLAFRVMGQNEAVVAVMYWYVALTSIDVAVNVRTVKAVGRPPSAEYDTVVRGV